MAPKKKKKTKVKAKRARKPKPERPPKTAFAAVTKGELACGPNEQKIGFEVRWEPDTAEAKLMQVRDNLALKASGVIGRGSIALRFCAKRAIGHVLDWILISDRELTNLAAMGQIEDGSIQPLDDDAGPRLKWSSDGELQ
jgi:hypothetical protein